MDDLEAGSLPISQAIVTVDKGYERIAAAQAANLARKAQGLPIGRPKGAQNRFTVTFRKAMLEVFENLGGVEALERWARKNPTRFFELYARSVPKEKEVNSLGTGVTILVGHHDDDTAAE